MDYKYPPIYKYIILVILITTFLKYYNVIKKDDYLTISIIFIYMVFIFDYVLIDKHPSLFSSRENFESKKIIVPKKKNQIKTVGEKSTKKPALKKKILKKEPKTHQVYDLDDIPENLEDTDTDNLTDEIRRELDTYDL